MLDGLRQLLNAEELPEGGRKAVETRARFKLQGDSFGVFVDECSELEASAEADKTRFYKAYADYSSSSDSKSNWDSISDVAAVADARIWREFDSSIFEVFLR
jgi:hypothetical protein